jgi:transcriptional regulator
MLGKPQVAPRHPLHLTFYWNAVSSIRMTNEARAEVLQGTLDLIVLRILDAMGAQHGYAIAARLEQVSSGTMKLNMGTLYPALMRLEQRGFIRGSWGTTDSRRRARFYALTPAGRRRLHEEKQEWERMVAIMDRLLQGEA